MDIPKTPSEHLKAVFGKNFPGKIAIFAKQDKSTTFFNADELAKMEKYCLKKAQTSDVYFGVGLVRDDLTNGRGKAEDVIAVPGTWLDIDIGAAGHKGVAYPPDIQSAWKIVLEFPVKPSMVVHSGYGLHAYWLFDELLLLDTPEKREKAAALSTSFQQKLRDLFATHGFKIDNTSDLARVLRVVGTRNHKNESIKKVRVIYPKSKEAIK